MVVRSWGTTYIGDVDVGVWDSVKDCLSVHLPPNCHRWKPFHAVFVVMLVKGRQAAP